jgi:prolyl 4-hydroxylase|tara:strand:+ start:1964 stop:2548 length:585 start_codon:yes stop_codon:yes gene_type:complete
MKEYKHNNTQDFIQGYYISKNKITDDLIQYFENAKDKREGICNLGVDKSIKDSTDINIHPERAKFFNEFINYFDELKNCLEIYKKKYKFCYYDIATWHINDNFNIQKYTPKQAYHQWHCERGNLKTSNRHLVWMTFLNDIKQGGETEFYYQKLKVKPEKGLTLFFPSDWTFTHKGNTTIDEDKYIITGWYHLVK